MEEEPKPGFVQDTVELIAKVMTAVGLNGSRMLWRWNRRRGQVLPTS